MLDRPGLLVTIDTEADSQWDRPRTFSFRNTRALERLQEFLERNGAIPTYLVTHEVASDAPSAEILRRFAEQGRAEIGAHLHPWSNPPHAPSEADATSTHPFPHDCTLDVFEAKMRELGTTLLERIGVVPRSYRAGRWGFVGSHAGVLQRLGYRVDTSVTPGVSWERMRGAPGGPGGVCFAGAPRIPYLLGNEDARRPGPGPILEIPVSIEWNRRLPVRLESRVDRMRPYGVVLRVLRRLRILRPTWLRPYRRFDVRDLDGLCDTLETRRRPVWNVMFHSSEAIVGASPYARDDAELRLFFAKLEHILARAKRAGAVPATLSGLAEQLRPAPPTGA